MTDSSYSMAELMIAAAAQAWRNDGELAATGIGPLPRLGAGLCKLLYNPALATTDGECWFTSEPLPPGGKSADAEIEGWANYDRIFSGLWTGKRHAMVAPVQIDRFGQTNISTIGERGKPKAALLGVRGYPGNSINHANSYFLPSHDTRALVAGEVDFVCSLGYNPARWPDGKQPRFLDLRRIVTNLAVLDFEGAGNAIRVRSLHPGVGFDEVQAQTGFPLERPAEVPTTPAPTPEQLTLVRETLDPHGLRSSVFKGDPPGVRS